MAATLDAATFDLDTISTRPAAPLRPVRLGVVVALVALIGVLGVLLASGPGGAAPGAVPAEASGAHAVVGPGDTMLSILDKHHPELDATAMRTAVASMAALNGGTRAVEPGQVVALPMVG